MTKCIFDIHVKIYAIAKKVSKDSGPRVEILCRRFRPCFEETKDNGEIINKLNHLAWSPFMLTSL